MNSQRVAIVGVTGAVGQSLMSILAERQFPVQQLLPIASERSVGKTVSFAEHHIPIVSIETVDWGSVDIAFFSAGAKISAQFATKASKAGCLVIDNTSEFRYEPSVPLIIPEVNSEALYSTQSNLIANPNCSTIQMLVALKPLHDLFCLESIDVATYQAVSGSGKESIEGLKQEIDEQGESAKAHAYSKPIAYNVLPSIDAWQHNGFTREEMKMIWETKKILSDDTIRVNPTCVRVPVINGHSEAVHAVFRKPVNLADAKKALSEASGVTLVPDNDYITALDADGQDDVYVSRLRQPDQTSHSLNLWVVADNIRKGAALNSVQIAEYLLNAGQHRSIKSA